MANNISLTASMRSNLLSLQNISRQVSSTQNKLATGNKVNSAIDNPSSYYTARSLNNRANDLDALLDSMGQAVSTIKAATTALETGATFLEQAAAVATSALETSSIIPAKEYFTNLIGANDAVVSTTEELNQALAAGKETIVIYGKLDLNQAINLRDNQKLVGINYFANFTGSNDYFSELNYTSDVQEDMITIIGDNTEISNLNINYNNTHHNVENSFDNSIIVVDGSNQVNVNLSDLNINFEINSYLKGKASCIETRYSGAHVLIGGNISMQTPAWGIFAEAISKITINGNLEILSATKGIVAHNYAQISIDSNSTINAKNVLNIFVMESSYSAINIANNVYISSDNSSYILSIAKANKLSISKGAVFVNQQTQQAYVIAEDYSKNYDMYLHIPYEQVSSYFTTENADYSQATQHMKDRFSDNYSNLYSWQGQIKQYAEILNQYDLIIRDSTYKGVNLLKNEKLNVRFNENGNADLNVFGKDMSANALGLSTIEWGNQGDIAQSLQEIASALKSIRAFTAELGNNYSIITNRQEFTENLINILTEGADKLTLADMNEESANMLSLQTRQQLAINSLSLASQASQAVLKLF